MFVFIGGDIFLRLTDIADSSQKLTGDSFKRRPTRAHIYICRIEGFLEKMSCCTKKKKKESIELFICKYSKCELNLDGRNIFAIVILIFRLLMNYLLLALLMEYILTLGPNHVIFCCHLLFLVYIFGDFVLI